MKRKKRARGRAATRRKTRRRRRINEEEKRREEKRAPTGINAELLKLIPNFLFCFLFAMGHFAACIAFGEHHKGGVLRYTSMEGEFDCIYTCQTFWVRIYHGGHDGVVLVV